MDELYELFPDGKKFRVIYDENLRQFKLLALKEHFLEEVIELFSDDNPAAFFMKQHGYNTSSRISVINHFGYFNIGLFFDVMKSIVMLFGKNSIAISKDVALVVREQLQPLYHEKIITSDDLSNPLEFSIDNISTELDMRDYQIDVIKSTLLLGRGRSLFECPTGSGKSFISANLLYTIFNRTDKKLRTLIYVPNRQLVDQFYKDLMNYGFDESMLSRFTGGLKTKEKNKPLTQIIISNKQYISRNMHKLPKIDIFLCDEVHSVSPDSSGFKFIENLNCPIKIGFSGTIPRKKYHKWSLIGLFGPIVHSEDIKTLQDQGFLADLEIVSVQCFDAHVDKNKELLFSLKSRHHYSEDGDIAFNAAWNDESKYITDNFRKLYTPIITYLESLSGNTLMLFDRIPFGEGLYDLMKSGDTGDTVWYIDGSTPINERERIREHLEKTTGNRLLAQSATFATGINIKNLPNIAFFFSGKAFSKIVQSIGRSLRLHKDKNHATLIDVSFNFKYSQRHLKERFKIYKRDYGKSNLSNIIKLNV